MSKRVPEAPDWLVARVELWRQRMGISGWNITVGVVTKFESPSKEAECETFPRVNEAVLRFAERFVRPGRACDRLIIHELLHVLNARVDRFINRQMVPRAPKAVRPLVADCYEELMEPVIENIACVIEAAAFHGGPRRRRRR